MATPPKGFTLLELLLSITIVAVMAAIAIPFYLSYMRQNDFHVAINDTVRSLRRAQMLAQAGSEDSPWGVRVEAGEVVLFKGESYALRDADFDEVFIRPNSIVSSGLSEMVFEKFSGSPAASGSIILTSPANELVNIVVNSFGVVEY